MTVFLKPVNENLLDLNVGENLSALETCTNRTHSEECNLVEDKNRNKVYKNDLKRYYCI